MYPNLSAEMARRRIGNKAIAELLNLSQSRISELMNGKAKIGFSIEQAKKIYAFLAVDMPLEVLFEKADE